MKQQIQKEFAAVQKLVLLLGKNISSVGTYMLISFLPPRQYEKRTRTKCTAQIFVQLFGKSLVVCHLLEHAHAAAFIYSCQPNNMEQ